MVGANLYYSMLMDPIQSEFVSRQALYRFCVPLVMISYRVKIRCGVSSLYVNNKNK